MLALAAGSTTWTQGAPGLPTVMVAGLTLNSAERRLHAATHGLAAWLLNLPYGADIEGYLKETAAPGCEVRPLRGRRRATGPRRCGSVLAPC